MWFDFGTRHFWFRWNPVSTPGIGRIPDLNAHWRGWHAGRLELLIGPATNGRRRNRA